MQLQHLSIHGHRVAFRAAGTGPVVLLVHGMAGSSATWAHVLPALAEHFTVVAPDLLGHGESGKPRRGEYSLGAHANVVRDLLHVLGHERATVVGQSLGGGVAMQLAYQYPERCERLVLVGSGGLGREVNLILRALTLPGADYLLPLVCTLGGARSGEPDRRLAASARRSRLSGHGGDLAQLRIARRRRLPAGVLSHAARRRRPERSGGDGDRPPVSDLATTDADRLGGAGSVHPRQSRRLGA